MDDEFTFKMIKYDEWFLLVSATAVAVIVAGLLVSWFLKGRWEKRKLTMPVPVACKNPNCARCRKYRQVQQDACKRYPWISKTVSETFPGANFDRIKASIQDPSKACTTQQAPTVLMIQDLPSEEIVTNLHPKTIQSLLPTTTNNDDDGNNIHDDILNEIESVPTFLWNTNDSPKGSWRVLSLLNQGSWNYDLCENDCPKLYHHVKNLPGIMTNCLFGNIVVSKICKGTYIEPHCGPTNARHRLQYALKLPKLQSSSDSWKQLSLKVGVDYQLGWKSPKDVFVFDDSFVHSVNYDDNVDGDVNNDSKINKNKNDDSSRIVLIIDLWHPDLTPAERDMIRHLYSPMP